MQIHRLFGLVFGTGFLLAGCGNDSMQTSATTTGTTTAGMTTTTGTTSGESTTEGPTTGSETSETTEGPQTTGEPTTSGPTTTEPTTGDSDTDTDTGESDSDTGENCVCAPGTDQIYVLSDDSELWIFDPLLLEFTKIVDLKTDLGCVGVDTTYSLAVDQTGVAWVLFAEPRVLRTADPMLPGSCQDPGVDLAGYGYDLFGMGFANNSEVDDCEKLYMHSYTGDGPFSEGEGVGRLGVIDPQTLVGTSIADINYDGGELAGTGDGRLFAFAGVDPVKLVEYDKVTGEVLYTLPLDGLQKTNASAFAFYGGDFYLFTESLPVGCDTCLAETCPADYEACLQDEVCSEQLECVMVEGQITDECGGLLSQELHTCLETCVEPCFPANSEKVSQVIHVDFDESDGPGKTRTVVVEAGPIRVVGASSSTCVPVDPPQ